MTSDPHPERRLRVLHLILMLGETNSQYNEHCLPTMGERDLTIVTYFEPRLTPPPQIAMFAGDGTVRGFLRALRAALDAGRYDVIHGHAPESAAMLVFALVVWGRFRRLRPSLAYTVHDSFYDYSLRNQALMLFTLRAFSRVVFCSRAAYDSFPRLWRWLVRDRWSVVQNGADFDRVDRVLAASAGAARERFTVVSVGRLEKVKDPLVVLEAFAAGAGPDDRLVFIGTGALGSALVERAGALALGDRVELTGLVERDEVFRRCAAADLFVSASRGEGLPVAVMEVMATGCPAVLSDIPQHRELLEGTEVAPLVATGDVEGFARQIRRFRELRPDERLDAGRRGREHVVDTFALARMHAGYEQVYRELARPQPSTARVP
ncbi:MAG TPA: glycosyltransferase family 4 protein [Actinomycetota bacterium]|nr:glycosyltransferase family 4 protein [Actinomycetota bacterium]